MRRSGRDRLHNGKIFLIASILFVTLTSAWLISDRSPTFAFAYAAAIIVVVINIISSELALYVLIFSMLLSPEMVVGATKGGMVGARGVTVRLDDILLVLIGLSWLAKTAVRKELGLIAKTPINRQIFLYVFVALVSTFIGAMFGRVNPKIGFFFVLKYFEYFFIFFMVSNLVREERQARRYVLALLLVCFIVSLIGILQIPAGKRVTAPFEGRAGEPNTLGGYLVLMMSLALGLLLTTRSCSAVLKWGLFLLLLVIPLPLFFTLSRSSWAAAIPMMGTFLIIGQKRKYLILMAVAAVIVMPLTLPQKVKERVAYTFQFKEERLAKVAGVTLDPSASERVRTWQEVSREFLKHPLLGYGVTGYPRFVDAQYIRVLVETGIMGLLSFALLVYSVFTWVYRRYKTASDPFYKGLTLGFISGTVAMLAHSIGANTFIIVRIMEPYWFLAALIIAYPSLKAAEEMPSFQRVAPFRSVGVP